MKIDHFGPTFELAPHFRSILAHFAPTWQLPRGNIRRSNLLVKGGAAPLPSQVSIQLAAPPLPRGDIERPPGRGVPEARRPPVQEGPRR